ncbi:MAG: carboxypeptidase regulatory-like domain-containing protein [Edaphobacter sp.]|uniref:carboxypeptidase regulatory-like domain-containing protein n=1 Tax=Edaphobacter sp. TaxID=1934404 RepID=UPI00239291E7|nr:carboxypeptidase regulatory-like domain-containing protein [Edaphobacter sp.]MDE1175811.1 carboxypeptidase regulatory-like domain-containing protein [Edaphobacter sp.]
MTRFYSRLWLCLPFALVITGCKSSPPPPTAAPAKPAVSYFKVDPATAGSVSGKITFSGRPPARKVIDMSEDPACVAAHKGKAMEESIIVGNKSGLENVFVYIKSGLEGKNFETPTATVVINQGGCQFHPHIIGVQVDQPVEITNSDPVTHNIHPMAEINREWNHSQGPGDPPMHRKFVKQEIMIPVKCNIHSWMHAYIGVLNHPYFTVSKEDGSFTIANLPPGTYTLATWQEKLGTQEQQVTVAPGGQAVINFTYKGRS